MRKVWNFFFKEQTKKIKEKTFILKMKKTLKFFLHPNEKKKGSEKKSSKIRKEKFRKKLKKKYALRCLPAAPPGRGSGAAGRGHRGGGWRYGARREPPEGGGGRRGREV